MRHGIASVAALVVSMAACGGDDEGGASGDGAETGAADGAADTTGTAGTGETGDDEPPPLPDVWEPGVVLPSDETPHPRGFRDLRGLVHTHSPFSHDACDEMPRDAEGNLAAVCMEDLRRGLCQVRHDFVFFTDHRDSFSDSVFLDVLLFDPARGDALSGGDEGSGDGGHRVHCRGCDGNG